MLLLVTIGLVVIAAVALVIGFVSNQLPPIYISIGCSFVAAVVLALFSRLSRRQAAQATASGTAPAPLFGPEEAAPAPIPADSGILVRAGAPRFEDEEEEEAPAPVAETASFQPVPSAAEPAWSEEAVFPIADYDELRVAEILPLLPELDADELEQVREREESDRDRATIISRIDQLLVSAPAGGDWMSEEIAPEPLPEPPPRVAFPIADYENLRVAEILPLLSELEPTELELVEYRERSGANRDTVLNRIAQLQQGPRRAATGGRQAPAKKAAAKKAPAKKAAAKKAPAKKAAATKAPAKKAPAKKAPAKKAATTTGGAKKAATKTTGAKKSAAPAKKTGAAKSTAKKAAPTKAAAPAKKAAATKAPAKKAGSTAKKSTRATKSR